MNDPNSLQLDLIIQPLSPPSNLYATATGVFLCEGQNTIAIGRDTRLEFFNVTPQGLEYLFDIQFYDTIVAMIGYTPKIDILEEYLTNNALEQFGDEPENNGDAISASHKEREVKRPRKSHIDSADASNSSANASRGDEGQLQVPTSTRKTRLQSLQNLCVVTASRKFFILRYSPMPSSVESSPSQTTQLSSPPPGVDMAQDGHLFSEGIYPQYCAHRMHVIGHGALQSSGVSNPSPTAMATEEKGMPTRPLLVIDPLSTCIAVCTSQGVFQFILFDINGYPLSQGLYNQLPETSILHYTLFTLPAIPIVYLAILYHDVSTQRCMKVYALDGISCDPTHYHPIISKEMKLTISLISTTIVEPTAHYITSYCNSHHLFSRCTQPPPSSLSSSSSSSSSSSTRSSIKPGRSTADGKTTASKGPILTSSLHAGDDLVCGLVIFSLSHVFFLSFTSLLMNVLESIVDQTAEKHMKPQWEPQRLTTALQTHKKAIEHAEAIVKAKAQGQFSHTNTSAPSPGLDTMTALYKYTANIPSDRYLVDLNTNIIHVLTDLMSACDVIIRKKPTYYVKSVQYLDTTICWHVPPSSPGKNESNNDEMSDISTPICSFTIGFLCASITGDIYIVHIYKDILVSEKTMTGVVLPSSVFQKHGNTQFLDPTSLIDSQSLRKIARRRYRYRITSNLSGTLPPIASFHPIFLPKAATTFFAKSKRPSYFKSNTPWNSDPANLSLSSTQHAAVEPNPFSYLDNFAIFSASISGDSHLLLVDSNILYRNILDVANKPSKGQEHIKQPSTVDANTTTTTSTTKSEAILKEETSVNEYNPFVSARSCNALTSVDTLHGLGPIIDMITLDAATCSQLQDTVGTSCFIQPVKPKKLLDIDVQIEQLANQPSTTTSGAMDDQEKSATSLFPDYLSMFRGVDSVESSIPMSRAIYTLSATAKTGHINIIEKALVLQSNTDEYSTTDQAFNPSESMEDPDIYGYSLPLLSSHPIIHECIHKRLSYHPPKYEEYDHETNDNRSGISVLDILKQLSNSPNAHHSGQSYLDLQLIPLLKHPSIRLLLEYDHPDTTSSVVVDDNTTDGNGNRTLCTLHHATTSVGVTAVEQTTIYSPTMTSFPSDRTIMVQTTPYGIKTSTHSLAIGSIAPVFVYHCAPLTLGGGDRDFIHRHFNPLVQALRLLSVRQRFELSQRLRSCDGSQPTQQNTILTLTTTPTNMDEIKEDPSAAHVIPTPPSCDNNDDGDWPSTIPTELLNMSHDLVKNTTSFSSMGNTIVQITEHALHFAYCHSTVGNDHQKSGNQSLQHYQHQFAQTISLFELLKAVYMHNCQHLDVPTKTQPQPSFASTNARVLSQTETAQLQHITSASRILRASISPSGEAILVIQTPQSSDLFLTSHSTSESLWDAFNSTIQTKQFHNAPTRRYSYYLLSLTIVPVHLHEPILTAYHNWNDTKSATDTPVLTNPFTTTLILNTVEGLIIPPSALTIAHAAPYSLLFSNRLPNNQFVIDLYHQQAHPLSAAMKSQSSHDGWELQSLYQQAHQSLLMTIPSVSTLVAFSCSHAVFSLNTISLAIESAQDIFHGATALYRGLSSRESLVKHLAAYISDSTNRLPHQITSLHSYNMTPCDFFTLYDDNTLRRTLVPVIKDSLSSTQSSENQDQLNSLCVNPAVIFHQQHVFVTLSDNRILASSLLPSILLSQQSLLGCSVLPRFIELSSIHLRSIQQSGGPSSYSDTHILQPTSGVDPLQSSSNDQQPNDQQPDFATTMSLQDFSRGDQLQQQYQSQGKQEHDLHSASPLSLSLILSSVQDTIQPTIILSTGDIAVSLSSVYSRKESIHRSPLILSTNTQSMTITMSGQDHLQSHTASDDADAHLNKLVIPGITLHDIQRMFPLVPSYSATPIVLDTQKQNTMNPSHTFTQYISNRGNNSQLDLIHSFMILAMQPSSTKRLKSSSGGIQDSINQTHTLLCCCITPQGQLVAIPSPHVASMYTRRIHFPFESPRKFTLDPHKHLLCVATMMQPPIAVDYEYDFSKDDAPPLPACPAHLLEAAMRTSYGQNRGYTATAISIINNASLMHPQIDPYTLQSISRTAETIPAWDDDIPLRQTHQTHPPLYGLPPLTPGHIDAQTSLHAQHPLKQESSYDTLITSASRGVRSFIRILNPSTGDELFSLQLHEHEEITCVRTAAINLGQEAYFGGICNVEHYSFHHKDCSSSSSCRQPGTNRSQASHHHRSGNEYVVCFDCQEGYQNALCAIPILNQNRTLSKRMDSSINTSGAGGHPASPMNDVAVNDGDHDDDDSDRNSMAASVAPIDTIFMIGTGVMHVGDPLSKLGRIIILHIDPHTNSFQILGTRTVNGAVMDLRMYRGGIVAAINNIIQLYRWVKQSLAINAPHPYDHGEQDLLSSFAFSLSFTTASNDPYALNMAQNDHENNDADVFSQNLEYPYLLRPACHYLTQSIILELSIRHNFIIVTTLHRSILVIYYNAMTRKFELVGADGFTKWTLSSIALNDFEFVTSLEGGFIEVLSRPFDHYKHWMQSKLSKMPYPVGLEYQAYTVNYRNTMLVTIHQQLLSESMNVMNKCLPYMFQQSLAIDDSKARSAFHHFFLQKPYPPAYEHYIQSYTTFYTNVGMTPPDILRRKTNEWVRSPLTSTMLPPGYINIAFDEIFSLPRSQSLLGGRYGGVYLLSSMTPSQTLLFNIISLGVLNILHQKTSHRLDPPTPRSGCEVAYEADIYNLLQLQHHLFPPTPPRKAQLPDHSPVMNGNNHSQPSHPAKSLSHIEVLLGKILLFNQTLSSSSISALSNSMIRVPRRPEEHKRSNGRIVVKERRFIDKTAIPLHLLQLPNAPLVLQRIVLQSLLSIFVQLPFDSRYWIVLWFLEGVGGYSTSIPSSKHHTALALVPFITDFIQTILKPPTLA